MVNCPICDLEMIWNSDCDGDEINGKPMIIAYYNCPACESVFLHHIRCD